MWATSVANEYGQVLNCVLTVKEFGGLEEMVDGLARRYSTAKQESPTVLYVDRDCCGAQSGTAGKIQELFSVWPDIIV